MKLYLQPDGPLVDIAAEVEARARRLTAAAAAGIRFFAFSARDPQDSATWIAASFQSPLVVVPLAPNLPEAARARALAQLPPGACVFPEGLPAEGPAPAPKHINSIYCVLFSSGSTGEPKGIALTGAGLRAAALAHAEHSRAAQATWLLDLSPAHVGGFSVFSRAHFLGSSVALSAPRFDAEQTLAWCRSGKVQGLSVVPTTLWRLLHSQGVSPADFSHLQVALLGGAPADPGLVDAALALGIPVRRTYGMTENASQAATETEARGGLRALPGVRLRTSKAGEIEVQSPFLAAGYFRAGQLEPLPLREGFLPTGDLGTLAHGILTVNGRQTELINTGGVKVFPAEIENALRDLPGLVECAAVGAPDAEWGEAVCLVVVGAGLDPTKVRAHLEPRLDRRKLPKKILLADALPRSATGKVLRADLKKLFVSA